MSARASALARRGPGARGLLAVRRGRVQERNLPRSQGKKCILISYTWSAWLGRLLVETLRVSTLGKGRWELVYRYGLAREARRRPRFFPPRGQKWGVRLRGTGAGLCVGTRASGRRSTLLDEREGGPLWERRRAS